MGGETHNTMALRSHYPQLAAGPVGKQINHIYRDRMRQFMDGGQYKQQGILGKLHEARVGSEYVKLSVYSPPDNSRPLFPEATSHDFTPTKVGESFGPSWSTHWFRVKLTVPKDMLKKERLEFLWDAGNEGLIWTDEGHTVHGLTGGGERIEWILPDSFRDGKEHTFYIEMACNGMFGNAPGGDSIQPPDPNRYYRLDVADIVAVNLEARALYFDFWEISDAAREFADDSVQCHDAQQVANRIMDAFIAGDGSNDSIAKGRKIATEFLGDKVDSHKVYEGEQEAIVSGIGYCHIDTCWLWPFAETRRKVNRSWSSQCDLIERYPELRFCCTQAQQYKWLEQDYPSTFDRVKKKVKEGSFQPIGGSWVEHDTNLPGGESLIRQFLYGQRYFESRFGVRCKTFWLPDTFGYSTQLPQICRISGMSRFLTQKLSWNNINNFPHTTFNWVALDNSQVICHMPPCETYTAEADFGDVKRSVTQHKSLDQDKTSLLVFGKGDGGGGPTWQHLEKLRRCRGMSDKSGMLPRLKLGGSADDFFDRLEKKVENGTELVTWYGELYFELHRGTYTTQAANKRNNRESEILLHDIEYLATLATIQNGFGKKSGYKYPKKDIDDMWESVLLCQFHDCLPGSSIEMCYDDSDAIYAKIFATGKKLLSEAMSELGLSDEAETSHGRIRAINTLSWPRQEIVKLPSWMDASYGLAQGDGLSTLEVRPLTAPLPASTASIEEIADNVFELRNTQFVVQVTDGAITSLYDRKVGREVIPKGQKAAQLVIYDDKPLYWQAWDVEVYHLKSRKELSPTKVSISENSTHRVSLQIHTQISERSWIKTTMSLPAAVDDAPTAIEIDAEIEWHETMRFLKVEFPVDIVNTEASYETQFGIVRRPTHYNTTWDMAKFEVCVHKWADLSEATYGVSILNSNKYGFATQGNVMRISLLRAPKAPDAHADMGKHTTRYAIFPHAGQLNEATVRKAFEFNNPLRITHHTDTDATLPSFRISGAPNLIIDTIKRGEDDADVSRSVNTRSADHSIILRIYDALGGKSRGVLSWSGVKVEKVVKVNALEDEGEVLEHKDGSVGIEVRAFEVASYKVCVA